VRNKFIVFEGIDGSGKSTQCSMLYNWMLSEKINARHLVEPTSGEYGRKIREMLKKDIPAPVEEQIRLFIEDRQQDFDLNIRPCLEKDITIVMDRYFYSNAAYQGSAELSPAEIIRQNIGRGFPRPDRVYFIDLAPVEAMKRIASRNGSGKPELFEKTDFLEKVRANFLSLKDERFLVIDGSLKPDEIFSIIKDDYCQSQKE
jgi:dTMP kinase